MKNLTSPRRTIKRDYERAVKRSISMPRIIHDRAEDKTKQRGFASFSDYIQDLIRRDTEQQQQNIPQQIAA